MRTNKFETRLQLNSNFENYDIELKKYFKTNIHIYIYIYNDQAYKLSEIFASLDIMGRIECLSETLEFPDTMVLKGLREAFNWTPIMQRGTDFSANQCIFSSLVLQYSDWKKIASTVEETSISWHNQGQIKGSPYASQYDSAMMVRGVSVGTIIDPY